MTSFFKLGRTGAHKPSAYRHTLVCLALVVKPLFRGSLPVLFLTNKKNGYKTRLFLLVELRGIEPLTS